MTKYITKYINKHGIAYNCDVHPKRLVSDTTTIDLKDYENINNYDTVYVITSALPMWFNTIFKRLVEERKKIILVTGDSILSAPLSIFLNDKQKFNQMLKFDVIQHWFAQNCDYPTHPKITPIPLGIAYHTIHRQSWEGEPQTHYSKQDDQLDQISKNQRNSQSWEKKSNLVFSDTHLSAYTNKIDREAAYSITKNSNLFFHLPKRITRSQFWNTLRNYKFVLSTQGAGLDCHRTWESLILGSVPIVKRTSITNLYKNLPIIWVDSYDEINANLLNEFRYPKEFSIDQENLLHLQYWIYKIKQKSKIYIS